MRWKLLLLLSVLLALGGCVTETTGTRLPDGSDKEAARANLDAGVGYLRQGDLPQAQIKLEKAIKQNPQLSEAYTALGIVFERMGDIEGAEKNLRRSVKLSPNDPDVLNAYAAFLCRLPGRREEALKQFDRALSIPPSQKYTNKAVLYANAGVCAKPMDMARAEEYLRQALRFDPAYSFALLQIADVAYQRGNGLQARAFLERYISTGQQSPTALWLGVLIEQSMGDAAAAERYGSQLKRDFPESVETRRLLEQERNAG